MPETFRLRAARRIGLVLAALLLVLAAAAGPVNASHEGPLAGQWHLDSYINCVAPCVPATPDSSGHDLHALINGPPLFLPGRFENAKARGAFTAPNSPLFETAHVTAMAWINNGSGTTTPLEPYRNIVTKGADNVCGSASYALYTGYFGAPGVRFYINNGAEIFWSPSVPDGDVHDGGWHMLVGTYDGSRVRLYVDGREAGDGTPASGSINYALANRGLGIGEFVGHAGCGTFDTEYSGRIDEARVYGRALSPTEIARMANDTSGSPPVLEPDPSGGPGPSDDPARVEPNFSFRRAPDAPYRLRVAPGGTARMPLVLSRNSTSTGRIRFRVAGLPNGVRGGIEPRQVTGSGTRNVELFVRATDRARAGSRPVKLTARPLDASAGSETRQIDVEVDVQSRMAAHVEGIEVNQAIQEASQPRFTRYDGVTLVRGKKTVVRVFAGLTGEERRGGTRPPLEMLLYGTGPDGRRLPNSPILPEWSPASASLVFDDFPGDLTANERTSDQAFSFVLPDEWTRGRLNLEAKVIATASPFAEATVCVEESCGATPTRALTGVNFATVQKGREISAIRVTVTHAPGVPNTTVAATPREIFAALRALSPLPIYFYTYGFGSTTSLPAWRTDITATDMDIWGPTNTLDGRMQSPGDGTVGVYVQDNNPGVTIGHTAVVSGRRDNGVMWRPVTSVAHEVFHLFGFKHASPDCGGGGPPWPLPAGRMGGIGLDTSGTPPYRVIPDSLFDQRYDLMSYCGVAVFDPDNWISVYNWERALEGRVKPAATAAPAQAGDELEVAARITADGVTIVRVGAAERPPTPGLGSSSYTLVARDAAGATVATVPFGFALGAGGAGAEPLNYLEARVPRDGVARVEVVDANGQVVATRAQGSDPPRVQIAGLRAGARIGKRSTIPLRLRLSGGSADTPLDVTVEGSADGNRRYHPVWAGPAPRGGAVSLSTNLLAPGRNARLRVRVSDGFRESTAVSPRLVVLPRRPAVQILEPTKRLRADAGGTVRLVGAAVDARGREIAGRRLVWRAGRRTLGRGAQLSVVLPAGVRRITLTATDSSGRRASDSVGARVRATIPMFVRLSARRVSRKARRAVLVVAATQPSKLAVGGRRYSVGTRVRRVRVRIRPGRKPLRVRLVLTAGGRRSVNEVVVRRK